MAFSSRRGQKGQMMLVMGLSMAVLAGFTAMAIDVGMAYLDRRDLQNDVDSAALAGVQHLPANTTLAQEKAEEWLLKNNITQDQITSITVESTHVANDTLRVEVDDDFGWIFARAVGMTTSNVGAHARAVVGTLEATSDLMPWSIVQGDSPCLDSSGNAIFGETCAVKLGAQSAYGGGWRGALGIDGETGSSAYEENIVDGEADTLYCIASQSEPPCEADIIDGENGNIVGPTGQGIEQRFAQGGACDDNGNGKDDFEVFAPTGQTSPAYSVACPDSPWLLIIPIVEYDGGQTVIIRGWNLSYFETYYCATASIAPAGDGSYVYSYDDVKAVSGVAPACDEDGPFMSTMPPTMGGTVDEQLYVANPLAGPLPAPAACHNGNPPHGSQTSCNTPTPTPTPAPTGSPGPTSSPGPSTSPTSEPTPSPTPEPEPPDCGGNGHLEVQVTIVDASYSQTEGFMGAFRDDGGFTIRKLIE